MIKFINIKKRYGKKRKTDVYYIKCRLKSMLRGGVFYEEAQILGMGNDYLSGNDNLYGL